MASEHPVTMIVSRHVRPGREEEYEQWIEGIVAAARQFPGYAGTEVIRPAAGGDREYVIVLKFDSYDQVKAWADSSVRHAWLERAEPLTLDTNVQLVSGLEAWFTLPGQQPQAAPAKYKMALLTTAALYPLLLLSSRTLEPLFSPLPDPLGLLASTAILVTLMTYLIMPRVTALSARWLYPRGSQADVNEK